MFKSGALLMLLAFTGSCSEGEQRTMTTTLPPCPKTPNCVSTLATDERHAIAPIAFSGSAEEAMSRLARILESMPRTKIVARDERSIQAVFITRLMRYRDDGMFVIDDEAKVIHFRSASRIGRSDWGVNRKRMEEIRKAFSG